jgi:trans-L-3-hydroxyproline dehydratase
MDVHTLDYHTGGEPLRIVTGGFPELQGESMLERRRHLQREFDHLRRFLMLEPRGHADMYGAVLTPPATADGDIGVLFMHNAGYSTMCGHGIIAIVTAGLEQGLFPVNDPKDIRIDSPAGRILARANPDREGKLESVTFRNVASFVMRPAERYDIGGRMVEATVAFGGAFYAYVDAQSLGFEVVPEEVPELIRLGQEIKEAIGARIDIRHPGGDEDLDFLYGTIFVHPGGGAGHSRNACVFAQAELDRSPTGTGVSGRAAIEHARGRLPLGEELRVDSIIGSRFRVRCVAETRVGDLPAVIPEVTGSAHMTGRHHFVFDPRDPLQEGFLLR